MKIRSITYFCDPNWPLNEAVLREAGKFLSAARPAFVAVGYEVQTARLASVPFPHLLGNLRDSTIAPDVGQAVQLARELEQAATSQGFDYISLGPAQPQNPHSYTLIPEILSATENVFVAGAMTSPEAGISLSAVRACAEIVHRAATLSPDGFANLYFAALANVPPGAPFFPAAYHSGDAPAFALATEAADLAVEAFTAATSLSEARQNLVSAIEAHAKTLSKTAETLSQQFGLSFGGIDFSLAPFPQESLSLGAAVERLGVPAVGRHGSLAAAAILAEAIDQASFRRAGFCGLMLPVLEDVILATRAAEGALTLTDLLLYSAVCGTGLDTLPLPGDVTIEQLNAILLDLAVLAQRLNKPLTARLMPIPGKAAGDPTDFDFAYFANSRVMEVRAEPLRGLLARRENLTLHPR